MALLIDVDDTGNGKLGMAIDLFPFVPVQPDPPWQSVDAKVGLAVVVKVELPEAIDAPVFSCSLPFAPKAFTSAHGLSPLTNRSPLASVVSAPDPVRLLPEAHVVS